jgi:DNA-binding HxlR family transcriptional regulator
VRARPPKRAKVPDRPHRYEQYCSIVRALDVIGDRWSLLIVRELMFAPKRYSDLGAALTGVSSNLLAARLRRLTERGVVAKRRLPAPYGSVVYELTQRGRLLEEVLFALSRFGVHYLGPPPRGLTLDAESWLYGMCVAFDRAKAGTTSERYQFVIDGVPAGVAVDRGAFSASPGTVADPAVRVTATTGALLALISGRTGLAEARAKGAVTVEGDENAFRRFLGMFAMPAPERP